MDAMEVLKNAGRDVDTGLKTALAKHREGSAARMYDMLAYFMGFLETDFTPVAKINAGKRFRPSLALFIAEAYGAREKAFDAAIAIELFHNFTLVHDDIEDRDEMRRNRPTVWKIWGDTHAINSGDMQSLLACELALKAGAKIAPVLLEAFKEVIEGQYMDFELAVAPLGSTLATEKNATEMTQKKTGALVRVSAEVAGIAAGKSDDEIAHLREYGSHLGIAFQLADDYRSVWSTEEETGKDAQSDIREHKRTVPILVALEQLDATARFRFTELFSVVRQLTGSEIQEALALINATEAQISMQERVKFYADKACTAARSLSISADAKAVLVGAVDALVTAKP